MQNTRHGPIPARGQTLLLALIGLVLGSLATSCAGPRLTLTNPKLRLTGDAARPLEWEVTVVNQKERGVFSLCRPGSAVAVIEVDAFLVRRGPFGLKVRLHGVVIADGGDPTLGFRDGLAPGESAMARFAPEDAPDLTRPTLFQEIEFRVTSREPPQQGLTRPKSNGFCHRWNQQRVENINALLATP